MAQVQVSAKTTWPELVGKSYEEAAASIRKENPELQVSKVAPGQPMTRDFRHDRVRIMVDENDVIIQAPSVG
ncbi:hypothetical protein V1264_003845 [Littorina saxatilis]|uniref:Uncharacterized protein n=1 Tax=Littorina saxatilis TaxID=31220 RepID=A0AAN9G663_9CAEN